MKLQRASQAPIVRTAKPHPETPAEQRLHRGSAPQRERRSSASGAPADRGARFAFLHCAWKRP